MRILFMRHLATAFNDGKHYGGRTDCSILNRDLTLTDDEIQFLSNPKVITYCSPMRRCRETLDLVKDIVNLNKVEFADSLMERDYGIHNGKTKESVRALIELGGEKDFIRDETQSPTEGESIILFKERIETWFKGKQWGHDDIFLLAHQGVLREIYSCLRIEKRFHKFTPGERRLEELELC